MKESKTENTLISAVLAPVSSSNLADQIGLTRGAVNYDDRPWLEFDFRMFSPVFLLRHALPRRFESETVELQVPFLHGRCNRGWQRLRNRFQKRRGKRPAMRLKAD